MKYTSSKTLSRVALGVVCLGSAAAGVALDARSAQAADTYTISPLNVFTNSSGDQNCFIKRYDGLFASGCSRTSVYGYFGLHRDQDLLTSLVGVYIRYSQSSQPLYCGLDYMTVSGGYGVTDNATSPAGYQNTTLGFAYSDPIPERATPYLWCRMYVGDHHIWGIRLSEQ